jgi:hypothetical protein
MVHGETLIDKLSGSAAFGYTHDRIVNYLGLGTSTPTRVALGIWVTAHEAGAAEKLHRQTPRHHHW